MEALVAIRTGGFLTTETEMEVPPNSLQREEVNNNDLGRWSPWWGGRQEGTSSSNTAGASSWWGSFTQ